MLAMLHPLTRIKDERGALTEIWRMSSDPFGFGQAYITTCKNGVVKAWHRHERQWDRWFCVRGTVLVGVTDGVVSKRIILSEDNPQLLVIPAGVWHGFTPSNNCEEAAILNLPNTEYHYVAPDEQRCKLDAFQFDWSTSNNTPHL